jgi:8-oxo-dGTP pyrophosphatase MutT (NUDIX family)
VIFNDCKHFLKSKLTQPLPGRGAQYLMAPETRLTNEEYLQKYPEHKISSVLLLLYPSGVKTNFVLIERARDKGVHSSQIALPGGKHELSDKTFEDTALRETEEEIGINRKDVILVGKLTDLFIPASRFRVFPHIGFMNYRPEFVPNIYEVKNVIEADLDVFLAPEIRFRKEFVTSYGQLPAPYFQYENYEIWGATAMIISEFIALFNHESANKNK